MKVDTEPLRDRHWLPVILYRV